MPGFLSEQRYPWGEWSLEAGKFLLKGCIYTTHTFTAIFPAFNRYNEKQDPINKYIQDKNENYPDLQSETFNTWCEIEHGPWIFITTH